MRVRGGGAGRVKECEEEYEGWPGKGVGPFIIVNKHTTGQEPITTPTYTNMATYNAKETCKTMQTQDYDTNIYYFAMWVCDAEVVHRLPSHPQGSNFSLRMFYFKCNDCSGFRESSGGA